jgi:asparagine synthase (glutamine-hydrolysing)
MCGIAGGVGLKNWNGAALLDSIGHRGPDSCGSFAEENVYLGHTRLSIQDLSENGNQPMFSADERYVIIFNGEIYNHLDVRKLLPPEISFRSTGDTETVLYAYIHFGASFLKLLNGIFALVIYDRETKEIFIARDHFGVKPLYIYQDHHCLLFSSEIKSFLQYDIDTTLNAEALANYLTFLWSPGMLTPFSAVKKLPPGSYIKLNTQQSTPTEPVSYYKLEFNGRYFKNTETELIDQLEKKLVAAVERQLLSDVPVGFFLSGGLDSSLIVAIARRLFPDKQLPCFTIDIKNWDMAGENFVNDIFYAKKVAELLQVDLNVLEVEFDIVKDFDEMIWHLDEPQADAAPLHVLNICRLARQKGIKVLLGGTGGDDLFSGYRRHKALKYQRYFKFLPSPLRKSIRILSGKLPVTSAPVRRLKKITHDIDQPEVYRMAGFFKWLATPVMKDLFSEGFRSQIDKFIPEEYLINLLKEIPDEHSTLNQMLFWEMKTFLVDHNLNYTDKMAMAVGVEARVPFLDTELVEFSTKIPPELKLKNGETKYILKKVAERYLPAEIIYRSKTGFGAPVRKWITTDLDEMITERLSKEKIDKQGVFNYDKVWELIETNKKGEIDASYTIWGILAIDSWISQFTKMKENGNTKA